MRQLYSIVFSQMMVKSYLCINKKGFRAGFPEEKILSKILAKNLQREQFVKSKLFVHKKWLGSGIGGVILVQTTDESQPERSFRIFLKTKKEHDKCRIYCMSNGAIFQCLLQQNLRTNSRAKCPTYFHTNHDSKIFNHFYISSVLAFMIKQQKYSTFLKKFPIPQSNL